MKTIFNLNKQLDEEEGCMCLNENSCILKYGIIPLVDNCIKPIYRVTLKPIFKGIKWLFKNIVMSVKECSVTLFYVVSGEKE